MEKNNYFNFLAFRKCLYDIELSERARVVYMHLLQKSSAKGSDEIELTKALIASDLGILTKKKDGLAIKNVQRALEELEAMNYIQRWQKYKGESSPLTIKMNLDEAFLRQKREENNSKSDKNEQYDGKKPSENVHHYNHYLSVSNHSLSTSNHSLSTSNHSLSQLEDKKIPTSQRDLKEYFKNRMELLCKDKNVDELNEIQMRLKTELDEFNDIAGYQDVFKYFIIPAIERKKEKAMEKLMMEMTSATGEANIVPA